MPDKGKSKLDRRSSHAQLKLKPAPGSAEILGAARLMRREGQYYVPLSTFP